MKREHKQKIDSVHAESSSLDGAIEITKEEKTIEKSSINKIKITTSPKTTTSSVKDFESLLQGKTLQVYWLLYEKGSFGIREIQKELNFSSPGIVSYQIQKLQEAGLVTKNDETGKYYIQEKITPGIMNFFVQIRTVLVPRFSIYLSVFLVGYIIYTISSLVLGDSFISHPGSIFFILTLVLGSLFFMYESFNMWKMKPN